MPKLPTKLSEEELLKIILEQKQEVAPIIESENDLPLFISIFALEPGDCPIPVKLLYRLYKRWSSSPLGEDTFYQKISSLLPNKRVENPSGKTSYLLNKDKLKINEDLYKLIKDRGENTIKSPRGYYYKNHLDNFLKKYIIEDGKDWVSIKYLHITYYKPWISLNKNSLRLGYKHFESLMKLLFTFNPITKEVAINKKAINAPQEKDKS